MNSYEATTFYRLSDTIFNIPKSIFFSHTSPLITLSELCCSFHWPRKAAFGFLKNSHSHTQNIWSCNGGRETMRSCCLLIKL